MWLSELALCVITLSAKNQTCELVFVGNIVNENLVSVGFLEMIMVYGLFNSLYFLF